VHDLAREGVLVISFNSLIPVLRIFNIEKAEEFYLGFLGFTGIGIIARTPLLRFTARFPAAI
jgi:hypothetical protein